MTWQRTVLGSIPVVLLLCLREVVAPYSPYQAAEQHAAALHAAQSSDDGVKNNGGEGNNNGVNRNGVGVGVVKTHDIDLKHVAVTLPSSTLPSSSDASTTSSVDSSPSSSSSLKAPVPDNFYYFTMCDYAGDKYPPGEFYPQPCVRCTCNPTTGKVHCQTQPCPVPSLNCLEYAHAPGECCPSCIRKGCYHRGKAYPPGAKIDSGPCEKCYCPWEGGDERTGGPTCQELKCPGVRCVDAVVPDGKCCPTCPNGPNCWLDNKVIAEGKRIYIDKCRFCYCSNMEYIYNATQRHATCVRSFFCL